MTPRTFRQRKSARNRQILEQRNTGSTYTELAREHRISQARLKVILAKEAALAERQAELAHADTLPCQPNPLHLTLETRRMVAIVVGHDAFTRDDVLAVDSARLLREPGFYSKHSRELKAWLART